MVWVWTTVPSARSICVQHGSCAAMCNAKEPLGTETTTGPSLLRIVGTAGLVVVVVDDVDEVVVLDDAAGSEPLVSSSARDVLSHPAASA